MSKHKQPAFWQQLTNFVPPGVGWWLIILIFCSICASLLLGWHLTNNQNRVNQTSLQVKTAPITPQTIQPPASVTQLIFSRLGVNLEILRLLAKQFQKTHPKVKINVPASIGSSGAIQAVYKDRELNNYLAKTPPALGLADIGTITAEKKLSSLKILKFNGIAPTTANISNGKYPLVKNLYFVFDRDKLSPHAQEFINFVKSSQGEKILKANSYLAVEAENKK